VKTWAFKPVLWNTLALCIGLIVVAIWVYLVGGIATFSDMLRINPFYYAILLAITLFLLFTRFLRWQFLLRQVGIRVPTRRSLSIYLASQLGIATPAYIGEILIRSIFLQHNFEIPKKVTFWVWVTDRVLDVAALSLILLFTFTSFGGLIFSTVLLALVGGIIWIGGILMIRFGVPIAVVVKLRQIDILFQALMISVLVWIPAALLTYVAASSFDIQLSSREAMGSFSLATLLGAVSLSPAGTGITGSVLILSLEALSINLASSVLIVTLLRITSTGLALVIGSFFLVKEIFNLSQSKSPALHFNEIADQYRVQFKPHVLTHLIGRKTDLLETILIQHGCQDGIGLDLGCGPGFHCQEMSRRGYRIFGMDIAYNLLTYAHQLDASVVNGDAAFLPFADNSIDYIYTIGVLHHIPSKALESFVKLEALRVLKPQGLLMVHETNPRNPLFRLYMGYVFPILRSIDEGTETWLEPVYWETVQGMKLIGVDYFTFIPDFMPKMAAPISYPIERMLERSRFRSQSVHYMAVLQKA
jgi:ubiquinone/menaquinone biosynthesis C-methylase UbiE/uncharacterized membrane protein YbhN (UPF0104 family)